MNKKILSFIYNKEKKEFLILKTGDSNEELHGKSKWYTVTGSVEKNESHEDAVKREVKEETDLDVQEVCPLKWGCIYEWQGIQHEELYFIAFVNSERVKLDNIEVIDYSWLILDDFIEKIAWDENKSELRTFLKLGITKQIDHPFVKMDDFTSKEVLKTRFVNESNIINLSWYKSDDFSQMKDVKQAYGICLDKNGRMLIISNRANMWGLPGGTVEKGETFEETLKREVDEEANIEINNLIPVGYNKIEQLKSGIKSVFYQLRYKAKITKLKKRAIDPATNKLYQRKFIQPDEFLSYALWGRPGEAMIKDAIK